MLRSAHFLGFEKPDSFTAISYEQLEKRNIQVKNILVRQMLRSDKVTKCWELYMMEGKYA